MQSEVSTAKVVTSPFSTSLSLSTDVESNEKLEVDTYYAIYGYDENGKRKGRLIVREQTPNRHLAREYIVTEEKEWKCLNCKIGTAKKNCDKYLVSIRHECSPIPYEKIEENQKTFETKHKELTRRNDNRDGTLSSSAGNLSRSESQMSKASFNSSVQQDSENNITLFDEFYCNKFNNIFLFLVVLLLLQHRLLNIKQFRPIDGNMVTMQTVMKKCESLFSLIQQTKI